MKHFTVFALFTLFFTFLIGPPAQAQFTVHQQRAVRTLPYAAKALPMRWQDREHIVSHSIAGAEVPSLPLNADLVAPSGFDTLPIVGSFAFQSDGRPLHNVQIDPSNPKNIHVIITDAQNPSAADTAQLLTRRCFYTFSSDGGLTWKPPVTFSTVRTGYADMQLFQRNGKYVPIIAAHRVTEAGGASLEVGVWIEKGNPGDGNFSECLAPRVTATGGVADIAWPTLAMSPTDDTAYVLGTVSGTTDQLQFGRFILNQAKDSAVFDGTQWNAEPGLAPNNGNGNFPLPGLAGAGGEERIRVSPSGKIGVMWTNYDINTPDEGIYFAESTDGGNTWPDSLGALWNPSNQAPDANGAQLATVGGNVDFWYDGENPKFLFTLGSVVLSNQTYYPSTASVCFFNPTDGTGQIVPIVSPILTNAQDNAAFEQTDSITESIRFPDPAIAWATVARTPDTNKFAVFYQTYVEGDTELVNTPSDPAQDTSFTYGSIYYQTTTDGGQTWSSATPLLSASDYTPKLDFRQPMTSDYNPINSNGPSYSIVSVVDTAPGNLWRNGLPGFDLHYYIFGPNPTAGVSEHSNGPVSLSLAPVFPNPVVSSANIQYSIATTSSVLLTVTDQLGRIVKTLVNRRMGAGMHEAVFNAADLPNGVYRCTLEAGGESVSKSMTLLR